MSFATPVVLLIFNRPDTTRRVVEALRQVRPSRVLAVADGPRTTHPGDEELCRKTRALLDQIDWPCEVLKEYAEANLGCGRRVSSGLDWAFSQVDEAIILEDDCLPEPSFFPFCEELLHRYRDDARVMHIGGTNFQPSSRRCPHSYYFSRYMHIWGWATWKRAWQYYDFQMAALNDTSLQSWLETMLGDAKAARFWTTRFTDAKSRQHTWDYQWVHCCWMRGGFSIIPDRNLVSNIGFGPAATHTSSSGSQRFANLPTSPMQFPLRHPHEVSRESFNDDYTQRTVYRMGMASYLRRNWRSLLIATKRD